MTNHPTVLSTLQIAEEAEQEILRTITTTAYQRASSAHTWSTSHPPYEALPGRDRASALPSFGCVVAGGARWVVVERAEPC
jgi:hypothetical protein